MVIMVIRGHNTYLPNLPGLCVIFGTFPGIIWFTCPNVPVQGGTMARLARVVIPGIPHHITQRGNRRQRVFFCDDDYRFYRRLMAEFCSMYDVRVLAYCLMPNHAHLVLTPADADGLHKAVGEAHRRYTRHVNFTHGWRGYLWQGRFASFPMDEAHLYRAVRYVELNPVDANLCSRPEQWPWSSAKAHLCGQNDELVDVMLMLAQIPDWGEYLAEGIDHDPEVFSQHERTGRPLGSEAFISELETICGRRLHPGKAGRKPIRK